MESKFKEALTALQYMVNNEIIKLTDNEYGMFFIYIADNGEIGITNSFEVEVEDDKNWVTHILDGEIDFREPTPEELGKKLLKWIEEDFAEWRKEELRKAISNYEQEQEDIYYMQHVR